MKPSRNLPLRKGCFASLILGGTALRRACTAVLLLLLVLACALPACAQEVREKLRVGFFAFDGYHMIDENGERSGYGCDFLRLAGRYLDVDFEYVGYENS